VCGVGLGGVVHEFVFIKCCMGLEQVKCKET
jgi:hypothetical protein